MILLDSVVEAARRLPPKQGGALLLGEIMTTRAYLGCALIFAGTILAQLPIDQLLHAAKRKPADVSRP